ncbi:MAG: hypothetical protein R2991_15375 [Thermoanaerobaculia bacterium]
MSDDRQRSPRRVGVVSLGCAKNLVDTEIMLGKLRQQGYELVDDVELADTVLVNTCGFVEEAREGRSTPSSRPPREGTGSGAGPRRGLHGESLRPRAGTEIPEIDGFVGLDDLERVERWCSWGRRRPCPRRPTSCSTTRSRGC